MKINVTEFVGQDINELVEEVESKKTKKRELHELIKSAKSIKDPHTLYCFRKLIKYNKLNRKKI